MTHIERNQVSTLRIQFYATLDLSAVGAGEVRVPLRPVTTTVETDIFGNKPPAESSTGTPTTEETLTPRLSGTPTEQPPTETATPTDDDGQSTRSTPATTPTPTPTSTPTETATPTGTETDDGGGLPLP